MSNRYGREFIDNAYLYHLVRQDHRHNFSIWFYHLYLSSAVSSNSLASKMAFVPQLVLTMVAGVKLYKDLPFCWFIQTAIFVTFNKVCTSQVIFVIMHKC